jgi:RNA-directed DNA polymerase
MPKDAPPNGGALLERDSSGSVQRVSGMQTKLHWWAAADPGRGSMTCSISCVTRQRC